MASHIFDGLELPASADFHVHLRQGDLMDLVTPSIREGGVEMVYVMPNLAPPITTVEQALQYQQQLQALEPKVTFLMSLYLHETVTPDTIKKAKLAGIRGVKSYPAGVTTNSESGVVDYALFYSTFSEMEKQGLVLNLHGESPPAENVTVLNAEENFLPTLLDLHQRFPHLRIVLEHCTTKAAIDAVQSCGPTVAGTITAHHLFLIVDDVFSDPFNFCKPVAKLPSDRLALIKAASSGSPKFFLGTDSAPHPLSAKRGGTDGKGKTPAGVFTQPYATQLVLEAFSTAVSNGILTGEDVSVETLKGFLGLHGRKFYGEPLSDEKIFLTQESAKVASSLQHPSGNLAVVPFRRDEPTLSLRWR